MDRNVLRPTWGKSVAALLPFLMPIFYIVLSYMMDNDKDIVNLDVSLVLLDIGGVIVLYIGYPISLPFKPLLSAMGLWEQSSFLLPTIPTLGGYVVVSLIYAFLIYVAWSSVVVWWRRRRNRRIAH